MSTAKDIMTTDVVTIKAASTVAEAIGLMKEHRIHALIVEPESGERGFGIITEADITYKVIAPNEDPKALSVADILTKPCITIRPDMSVKNVAKLFAEHCIHRAPVVQDELLGIVSVSDVLQKGKWW